MFFKYFKRVNLIFFILSILTLFADEIFNRNYPVAGFYIVLISIGFLLVTAVLLAVVNNKIWKRFLPLLIAALVIYFSLYCGKIIIDVSNFVFITLHKDKLDELGKEIVEYKKIFQMNAEGKYGRLNNVMIVPEITDGDTLKYFEYRGIDKKVYDSINKKLNDLNFYDFDVENQNVFFGEKGNMDYGGLCYSLSNQHPKTYQDKEIILWEKIRDNWYYWGYN
jgi:hypothetical protein